MNACLAFSRLLRVIFLLGLGGSLQETEEFDTKDGGVFFDVFLWEETGFGVGGIIASSS